jgi:glycosyltransferase involved in cell wall biosynthesis
VADELNPASDDLKPHISVVVCTHNRAELLRGALASLSNMATDDRFTYEIVVVDNASTDATPQTIAAAAAESKNPLRGVREAEKGIVAARNRGIRESSGRWIAFFDDDQLADRRWLVELYLGAVECHARVVGGAVHLALPAGCRRQLDPAVRMLLGESRLSDQRVRYGGRRTPGCGNLMIERKVFDEVGAFQRTVHGRGEDTDLFSRIEKAGIPAWYLPAAIIHHITPAERLEDQYLLDLARRMGQGVAERQTSLYGPLRMGLLRLGKALRTHLVQQPLATADRWLGNHEAWLGRQCLVVLNQEFLRHTRSQVPRA